MKVQIKNRFTGNVQCEVEIDAAFESQPLRLQLGAAVKVAYSSDANLSDADLSDADLRGADLRGADLRGADLSGADLSDADLSDANLSCANLSCANLSCANLSDALSEDIAVPSLHRRILAAIESGGTLEMNTWHTCETTHCRAGWAIQLAGAPGRVLEACLGPSAAGALIHVASCPQLEGKVPNFMDTNENALADIRRLAALEPELEPASPQQK